MCTHTYICFSKWAYQLTSSPLSKTCTQPYEYKDTQHNGGKRTKPSTKQKNVI